MQTQAPILYRITAPKPEQHLYHIELHIAHAQPGQRLSLPVWIPGSYLVREFAQHLQGLQDGAGQPLQQINKNTWVLADTLTPNTSVTVRYQVYALDRSVRTAYLDTQRAFFNPTSLCLRVEGQEAQAHHVHLPAHGWPSAWAVATPLHAEAVDGQGWGHYRAQDYDELADSPWEIGRFWQGGFQVRGCRHVLVVSGADTDTDWAQLLADTERICATQMAFWHPDGTAPPWGQYMFLLHASHDGYGGLEHRHSTALICQRKDLPRITGSGETASNARPEGYLNLLGLISHEYFHTWNVKRLRPLDFSRYDYNQENYTDWLWFFEGFTSYYDELLLWRAGLIDENAYLKRLSKTINQVLETPGRHVQSVAQASFEAWTKYYRPQENTPNATVSYYSKGALIALCLDLGLRSSHPGGLDTWMQTLFTRTQGGPMAPTLPAELLLEWGREDLATALNAWVHGTSELPLESLLRGQGIGWKTTVAPVAQVLGLRLQEQNGLWVKNVMRDSAAESAGMVSGDEWIAWHVAGEEQARRLARLSDLARCPPTSGTAWVARDGRLFALHLSWPTTAATTVELQREQKNPFFWPSGR